MQRIAALLAQYALGERTALAASEPEPPDGRGRGRDGPAHSAPAAAGRRTLGGFGRRGGQRFFDPGVHRLALSLRSAEDARVLLGAGAHPELARVRFFRRLADFAAGLEVDVHARVKFLTL